MAASTMTQNLSQKHSRHAVALVALASGLAALCSGCDKKVGVLNVQVLTSPIPAQNPLSSAVETFHGVLYDENGVPLEYVDSPFEPGVVPRRNISAGPGRVLLLQGIRSGGIGFSSGRTLPFNVEEGENTIAVYMGIGGNFSLSAPALDDATPGRPRGGHQAIETETGQLLLMGGGFFLAIATGPGGIPFLEAQEPIAQVDVFDPTSGRTVGGGSQCDSTHELCLHTPRRGAGVTSTAEGLAVVFGGVASDNALVQEVEIRGAGTWLFETVTSSHAAAFEPFAVTAPTGAVAMGGFLDANRSAALQDAIFFDAEGATARHASELLQCGRGAATGAQVQGKTLLFGGFDGTGIRSDFEIIDLETESSLGCEPLPDGVTARALATATVHDDHFVILTGGVLPDGSLSDEIDIFDFRTSTLCAIGSLPQPRAHHQVADLEGRLLLVGGVTGNSVGEQAQSSVRIDLGFVPSQLDSAAASGRRPDCADLHGGAIATVSATTPRWNRTLPSLTTMANGFVLLSGGFGPSGQAILEHEILVP